MVKTPITVLQEMMIKLGLVPEYECVSQSGPQHKAMFEYRCSVYGSVASGLARSKKEAKQEAARHMLQVLYARGMEVPPPYATLPDPLVRPPSPPSPTNNPALEAGPSAAGTAPPPPLDTRSYVALLKELCEEYRLGEAQYELVGDTGPAHQRHFTVRISLGLHSRQCTSTTKKAARQQAAEQLYKYLRDNLSRLTGDFVEEEALARALEKSLLRKKEAAATGGSSGGGGAGGSGGGVGGSGGGAGGSGGGAGDSRVGGDGIEAALARYTELREAGGRCLDLGQLVSEYHLDESKRKSGAEALEAEAAGEAREPERALRLVCAALGLRVEEGAACGAGLSVLRVLPSSPPLAFAAPDRPAAARVALRYLRRGLLAPAANKLCVPYRFVFISTTSLCVLIDRLMFIVRDLGSPFPDLITDRRTLNVRPTSGLRAEAEGDGRGPRSFLAF